MPYYMLQATLTPHTWEALTKKPVDRTPVISAHLEKLGGRLAGFYYSSGEYDVMVVYEAPNEVRSAAFASSIAATAGLARAVKRTSLMTPAEAMEAMRQAGAVPFQAPIAE